MRWSRSKRTSDRHKEIFDLWRLCAPEIKSAAKHIAGQRAKAEKRHVSVAEWWLQHGIVEEDVEHIAWPAIPRAAKKFDPSKGTFQTFAWYHIREELRRHVATFDPLNHSLDLGTRDPEEEPEDDPAREASGESDLMVRLFESPREERFGRLRDLDAKDFNRLFAWLNEYGKYIVREVGSAEFFDLRSWVATVCMLKMRLEMRPKVKGTLRPESRSSNLLGMRITKMENDGGTRDLTAPLTVRALRGLRGQRLSERDMAGLLGMSQKGYRGLRDRIEERGLDVLEGATLEDLDAAVRGKRRGPKPKQ